jgi:two-component system response regulator FixJ
LQPAVFVVDDDEAVRQSIVFLMRASGYVSRGFASPTAFLSELSPDNSGCIITDVRMPDMDGLELVAKLAERDCIMPVIMITGHADVATVVRAMKSGILEFIEKPFDAQALLEAVEAGLEQAARRQSVRARQSAAKARLAKLTDREAEVLERLIDGLTSRAIGKALAISARTVEGYRANIMLKMQVDSIPELVRTMIDLRAAPAHGPLH